VDPTQPTKKLKKIWTQPNPSHGSTRPNLTQPMVNSGVAIGRVLRPDGKTHIKLTSTSIGSVVSAGLTVVANQQTDDRARRSNWPLPRPCSSADDRHAGVQREDLQTLLPSFGIKLKGMTNQCRSNRAGRVGKVEGAPIWVQGPPSSMLYGRLVCTWVKLLTDQQILGCELHKNAFGGRAPHEPAGGAIALHIFKTSDRYSSTITKPKH